MESPVIVQVEVDGEKTYLSARLIDYGVFCKVRLEMGCYPEYEAGQIVSTELANVYFTQE